MIYFRKKSRSAVMAADHYLNKVFIYILPVKTTIPHQPFPAPFTKSSTRGRE